MSDHEPTIDEPRQQTGFWSGSSKRARITLGVAMFIAVAILVSSFVNLNEYAITPGQATSVVSPWYLAARERYGVASQTSNSPVRPEYTSARTARLCSE